MKPPARAVVDHLVWSTDGGVWAVWGVEPFAHAHASVADQLATHSRLRGLLVGLAGESMLLSVCERIDPWDVVADMSDGVDLSRHHAWSDVCDATASALEGIGLFRRRFYVACELSTGTGAVSWWEALRTASADVAGVFGVSATVPGDGEVDQMRRLARGVESAAGSHVSLRRVSAGEIRWLYARLLRRGGAEPALDESWEPASSGGGVLAHLTDAVVFEGGHRSDQDRPRHRRYLRVDAGESTVFQTVLAVADMPHSFRFPGGGGEWLFHVDDLGFPIDWCVRVRAVPNAEAQVKVRRQHRQLVGQVDEYDGETSGAPPSLAEAIAAVDLERAELSANPAEPELHATILLSVAAADLGKLEDRARAVSALFEPHEYGLGRPTGGQVPLLRSMLPGTAAAPVCRDYTQFLLPRDLAGGAPFCGTQVGDPAGMLLGVSLDAGSPAPVLFDPTFGPTVGRTASLAAVGALGSGKSFFLKRLCWDTLARGGQVVTIDRTAVGEYARFARVAPGDTQVVSLTAGADVCLDPLRIFDGEARVQVTLGFLSLLTGVSAHSEEGTVLAEAVHRVADDVDGRLVDVITQLQTMASTADAGDTAARGLARRLDHFRRLGVGQLAFGDGDPVSLDADFIVFWAPHLSLPDRDTLLNEHLARQMLPEQILGNSLLYLVAAVGREVVFRDPSRFGAALYDEAWALLGSPYGQRLLLEGVRDGRKHNGAIWLATQHPADLGSAELVDLLGARLVFRQSPGAIPAALDLLGVDRDGPSAGMLRAGMRPGRCLIRDVRDRVGLVEITEPAVAELRDAFDTTPRPYAATSDDDTATDLDLASSDLDPVVNEPVVATLFDQAPDPTVAAAVDVPPLDDVEPEPRVEVEPEAPRTESTAAEADGDGVVDGQLDLEVSRGAQVKVVAARGPRATKAAAARDAARRRRRSPLADALSATDPQ